MAGNLALQLWCLRGEKKRQRTDIEASESCVGLSVSIPPFHSFCFFPSVFEKVKVERGLKEKRGGDSESERNVLHSLEFAAAEAEQGRAEDRKMLDYRPLAVPGGNESLETAGTENENP